MRGLNESPSEKEGKCRPAGALLFGAVVASMKALPKRKRNLGTLRVATDTLDASMKALPKRKGNTHNEGRSVCEVSASMKALPKRKGNDSFLTVAEPSSSPQ